MLCEGSINEFVCVENEGKGEEFFLCFERGGRECVFLRARRATCFFVPDDLPPTQNNTLLFFDGSAELNRMSKRPSEWYRANVC